MNATSWFCYLLRCADGTLYAGITNDLAKRLAAHNRGEASKYTRSRLPAVLVYAEPHPDRAAASRREMQLKKMRREEKLALAESPPALLSLKGQSTTNDTNFNE